MPSGYLTPESEQPMRSATATSPSAPLCVSCGMPIDVPKGTIAYYHRECRKDGKRRYGALINAEIRKERPWYFWVWLWIKRTAQRIWQWMRNLI